MTSYAGVFHGCDGIRAPREVTFMVHADEAVGLNGLQVEFDDERVVSAPA